MKFNQTALKNLRIDRMGKCFVLAVLLNLAPVSNVFASAEGDNCSAECDARFLPLIWQAQSALTDAWNSANVSCCSQVGGEITECTSPDCLPGMQGCAAEPNCQGEYTSCMQNSPGVIIAQTALTLLELQYQQCLEACEDDEKDPSPSEPKSTPAGGIAR